MAINVMQAVWDHSEAKGSALLVMLRIADAADPDGSNAWPKQRVLCEKTKLGKTAVKVAIAAMIESGELVVERRDRRRGNSYTVILPGLESYKKLRAGFRPSDFLEGQIPALGGPDSDPAEGQNPAFLKGNHPVNHPRTKETSNEVSSEQGKKDSLDAGQRLCEIFGQLLVADNEPAALVAGKVKSKGWQDAARLLIVKDDRDPYEAERLLRWSQHDDFWRSRILSPKSFRANYRSIRVAAEADGLDIPTYDERPEVLQLVTDDVWAEIREAFANLVGPEPDERFLEQLWVVGLSGAELWIAGEPYARSWVNTRYTTPLLAAANSVLDDANPITSIRFADLAPEPSTNEQPLEKETTRVA